MENWKELKKHIEACAYHETWDGDEVASSVYNHVLLLMKKLEEKK